MFVVAIVLLSVGLCIAFESSISSDHYIVSPANLNPTNYPLWAHYHWVWLHHESSNQANVTTLVQQYLDHDIPVGGVNIDSEWETQFNNFVVDTEKFPSFSNLIESLHNQDIHVILWITSMVNVESPSYQYCVDNNFLIRDSRGIVRPLQWWHGSGGLLDYSNPYAVAWWHQQMDLVLDVGVDGFKCDGTDPYIMEYSLTGGALGYNDMPINYTSYAHMYYRDFLTYTRQKRSVQPASDAGLIMSRPVDCMLDDTSKLCWGYSPRDVMFSGWVGDDDATFNGLRGCLRKVIYSAWLGYANYGCDIGGYRGDSKQLNKELFLRSTQVNAFLPLMENGGGGEHRPWMYDDETVVIYRHYVNEHHRLSPYLHTIGAYAVETGSSSIHPIATHVFQPDDMKGDHDKHPAIPFPQPSSYSYVIGEDILVHPVVLEIENNSMAIVDMTFPNINNQATIWLDWWKPYDMSLSYAGDSHHMRVLPLDKFPVYVRQNAYIPLQGYKHHNEIIFTWFMPSSSTSNEAGVHNYAEMRESSSDAVGNGLISYASIDISSSTLSATISAHDQYSSGIEVIGVSYDGELSYEPKTSACMDIYDDKRSSFSIICENVLLGVKITVSGVMLKA